MNEYVGSLSVSSFFTDQEGVFTLCQNPPAEWQAGQGARSLRIRTEIPTYKPSTALCEPIFTILIRVYETYLHSW